MNSIRNRLLLWLLCGLGALLVAGGAGVYFSSKESLLGEIEAELRAASRDARIMARGGGASAPGPSFGSGYRPPGMASGRPEEAMNFRWPEFDRAESGFYYQVWSREGRSIVRSPSLGKLKLPRPEGIDSKPRYLTVQFSEAEVLRAVVVSYPSMTRGGFRGRPGYGPGPGMRRGSLNGDSTIEIMVARDLSAMEETLSGLIGKIFLFGLAIAIAAVFLVSIAVRRGLSPLRSLGEEVAAIDASSLDSRFATESLPRELLPISNRLNDLIARLERSFERERRFSSDLAHELRTPIAELRAIAEVGDQWPEEMSPDQTREILEISLQMQNVVETLLALSRWEQASGEWEKEDVALATLVDECWQPYSAQAKEKQLAITMKVAREEVIQTDPGLFRHILNNLFSNAVEYTPRSGSVCIETLSGEDGRIVGMSVANSVNGLKPDDVPHLLDRFWRRDESRTDSGHSGLGLSLAKACAEVLSLDLSAKLENDSLRFDLTTLPA